MSDKIMTGFAWCFIFGSAIFGIKSCVDSKWWSEQEADRIAVERAKSIPHVIREADGCKVYAFDSASSTHYFTRCKDHVTTERNYTAHCGKGCVAHKKEEITTEGN